MKEPLVEGMQDHDLLEAIELGYKLVGADSEVPQAARALALLKRQIIELGIRGKAHEILEKLEQTQHSPQHSESFRHAMRAIGASWEIRRAFYSSILKSIGHFSNTQDVSSLENLIMTLERYSILGRWGGGDRSYVKKIINSASFEIRRLAPPESFEAIMERVARAKRHEGAFVQSLGAMVNPKMKR